MWLSYENDLINLDRSTSIFLKINVNKIAVVFSEDENFLDSYTMKFSTNREAEFIFEKIRDGLILKRSLLIVEHEIASILETHQD